MNFTNKIKASLGHALAVSILALTLTLAMSQPASASVKRVIGRVLYQGLPFVALSDADQNSCNEVARRANNICKITGLGSALGAQTTSIQSTTSHPFKAWEVLPRNVMARVENGTAGVSAIFLKVTCASSPKAKVSEVAPTSGAFGACK